MPIGTQADMAQFLLQTTPQPDRYYKYVTASELDNLKKLLNRDDIHIFHNMHMKIAYFQFIGVLMIVYVGFVLGEFWHSAYFSWGVPVKTRDVTITVPWKYWLLLATIAWDRIFAKASSYVIGNWRVNVVFNAAKRPMPSEYYSKTMFILLSDHAVNLLRYAVMIVFLYSQIDFALAFAIPDVLIDIFSSLWSVDRLVRKYKEQDKVLCIREDPTPVSPDDKLPKNVSGWNISPFVLTWFQWLEVLLFILVFLFTGYFDSPYFQFGAPFPLFGKMYKSQSKYGWFVFFVFVDQIFYSIHSAIVGPYITSSLLNNSNPDIIYPKAGARFIYIARKVFGWVRVIFLLFFILSQFSFLLAMIAADLLVTFFMLNKMLSHRYIKPNSGQRPNWFARIPLSEMYVTIVVLIELTIVVIVSLAQLRVYKLPYFQWPPPLLIFDTLITSKIVVSFICIYAFVDRIVYAFTTEITFPYIANVLTGCDPDGMRYDTAELVMIVFMDTTSNWVRRIVGFNFLLGNFSLALFQAFSDILCSAVILEHYLAFKDRANKARMLLQYKLDEAPVPPPPAGGGTEMVQMKSVAGQYGKKKRQTLIYDNSHYYQNYFEMSSRPFE